MVYKGLKWWHLVAIVGCSALALSAALGPAQIRGASQAPDSDAPPPPLTPFAASEALEAPAGDLAVTFHRPNDQAPYHAQVQIGFDAPLAPLTDVSAPRREEVLSHFSITPTPPGVFRLVGDQAVVFSPEAPFPAATEYTVKVAAGLTDIHGRELPEDYTWTFNTQALEFQLRAACGDETPLSPHVTLESNGPVDVGSLRGAITFTELGRAGGGGNNRVVRMAWSVEPDKSNPPALQDMNQPRRSYRYRLIAGAALKRNTRYRLTIEAGVQPESGNMPSAEAVTDDFSTYGPLALGFDSSERGGRWHRSDYWIEANNTLDRDTVKDAVSIDPPVTGDWFWAEEGSSAIYLAEGELRPDTEYTLTVNRELRDIFGQRLSRPWTHTFRTSHLWPRIEVREGVSLLTTETDPVMPFRAVNPGSVNGQLLPLTEERLVKWCCGWNRDSADEVFADHADDALESAYAYGEDAVEVGEIDLGPVLGASPVGLALFRLATTRLDDRYEPDEPVVRSGALLRTNLGVHAQLLPDGLRVWAVHLLDGSAASDCPVTVYRPGISSETAEVVARATTDGDGLAQVSASELTGKAAGEACVEEDQPFVVIVREGDDLAYVSDRSWLGTRAYLPWDVVRRGWDDMDVAALGEIFSDRQLYQPDDQVRLKGVVRYRRHDRLLVPAGTEFALEMYDPRGDTRDLGTVTADEFGAFEVTVDARPGESLGYYSVTAKSTSPSLEVSGHFRRADFSPPRYKAELTTDQALYFVGDTIEAKAKSDYLFGAPLSGGEGVFHVTAESTSFRPEGWDAFSFSFPDWVLSEMEDRESPERDLVKQTKELDANGEAALSVPVVSEDPPTPMAYTLAVAVHDVSGQSVGASQTVTTLPHRQLTGVRLKRSFVAAGSPCSADVIVTDPDGRARAGVGVRLELLSYEWVAKKVERDGEIVRDYALETRVIATTDATSAKEPVTVSITPPTAGEYLVVARFAGQAPTGTEGAGWLYASGRADGSPTARESRELDLYTDKREYRVGDEVEVAVACPFHRARMLATVEREKVFAQECDAVTSEGATFRFRVTEEMIPNVWVQVSLAETDPDDGNLYDDPDHLPYRIGFANVPVSRDPHRLKVDVKPEDEECRPGAGTAVDFHVEDATGHPAQVQLTAMVVDEAILQMTGYRPPDLVQSIYPDRELSLDLFDNRPLVIRTGRKVAPPPKGWGYDGGGDGSGGTPATYLRKDFARLAYFNADLRTDANGDARCQFEVPDSLTTWRVLAVAVSAENDFGAGDATFLVNQPLMLLGLIPRFARVDDSITTGVAVSNQSGSDGQARVTCTLTEGGELLQDAAEPLVEQSVEVADNRTGAVRFPKLAKGVGGCTLEFACEFEGEGVRESDRLQLPLVVQEPGYWETVAVAREVADVTEFPIEVTDAVRDDLGYVKVTLASTALGNMAPDAEWLLEYPYGCAEQLSSRLIGILAFEGAAERYGMDIASPKPLDSAIRSDIGSLLACQKSNGGFAAWPTMREASEALSAYAAVALSEARARGYEVPDSALEQLREYLAEHSGGRSDDPRKLHLQVLQAQALKALDRESTMNYGNLLSNLDKLPLIDHVRLDSLLHQNAEWGPQAEALFGEIKENEWITVRGAHLEEWPEGYGWWWMNSPDALLAAGLKLDLLVAPEAERVSRTASTLVRAREGKRWRNTYDAAQALDALAEYAEVRESTPPDFVASLALDGSDAADYAFRGYDLGLQSQVFPLAEVSQGQHVLTLRKSGEGTLYSTVEFTYVPKGEQPPRSQGFFIEREMTNLRTDKPVDGPDASVRVGDVVRVKLTINAPQRADDVVVEAPVPAGLETIDASFATTPQWDEGMEEEPWLDWGWNWTPFEHTEFRRDHVALFARTLDAGVYEYEYLLQATNPGDFTYPPTRVYRMYEPEEFGSTKSERVRVVAS